MNNHLIACNKLEKDIDKTIGFVSGGQQQMELAGLSKILKILNVFKVLPVQVNMGENRDKHKDRETREEDFLFQIWYLLNPLMTKMVSTKVIGDFIKMIYVPYMPKDGNYHQQKVDLTLEYVLELKKISQVEEKAIQVSSMRLQKYY